MGKRRRTSAKAASKVLRDERTSRASKAAAASALSQCALKNGQAAGQTLARLPSPYRSNRQKELRGMAVVEKKQQLVEVTVGVTDEDTGDSQTKTLEIPGGPTPVPELKSELGIEGAKVLWVVEKHGKKKALSDHQTHDVKEGDHYEAIVKGGIS